MTLDMAKLHSLDLRATIAVGYPTYAEDIPNHSALQWLRAAISAAVTLCAFDYGGSREAKRSLEKIRTMYKGFEGTPPNIITFKARRDSAVLRALMRLVFGMRACFAESFAICAGLRCLGFDSYVVVGYASIELFTPTQLHAWVECNGEPVSDPAEIKYGYLELQRYI
jgi:hypothetical protein